MIDFVTEMDMTKISKTNFLALDFNLIGLSEAFRKLTSVFSMRIPLSLRLAPPPPRRRERCSSASSSTERDTTVPLRATPRYSNAIASPTAMMMPENAFKNIFDISSTENSSARV